MQAKVENESREGRIKTLQHMWKDRVLYLMLAPTLIYFLDFQGMADYQYEAGFLQLQGQRAVGICRT